MRTIGQMLRASRESKKLNLDDVNKATRIHPKFLRALEMDDYSLFNSKVHAKGFLKLYAEHLDVSVNDILALWRREYEIAFDKKASTPYKIAKPISDYKLVLTPQLVFGLAVAVLLTVFVGYIYAQFRTYSGAPRLDIFNPPDGVVLTTDVVDVTGSAEVGSELFINRQKVVLNPGGGFGVSIRLNEGVNSINIEVVNRLGRKADMTKIVVYRPVRPDVGPSPGSAPEASQSTGGVGSTGGR